jgi:ABC-2 type transport system ATP-binding protein
MIEVSNICKSFDNFKVLDDLSCNIKSSSIYGLIGHNGAGKTTLLKTLAGIYQKDSGNVFFEQEEIFDNEKMKQKCFFVPDELYFLPHANLNRMAKFYKGYFPKWSDSFYKKLTNIFEFDPNKRLNSYSKGLQRQAAIILALSTQPKYLLLDESFDGLDPEKRILVKQLLTEYMAEKEASIMISSHNLRELEDLCDNMGLIKEKKIIFDCSLEDVKKNRNKFRLAFKEDITQDAFSNISLKNFYKSGKIITFIASGDSEDITAKLEAMNPAIIEVLPLTLEEIFLDEMEAKSYDFKELFN